MKIDGNAQRWIRRQFQSRTYEGGLRRGLRQGLQRGLRAYDYGSLDTIAQTIQRQEGYYPGSLAYANNNPGNLIYVGQAGAVPGAGGFAKFPTYDAGYQALLDQISRYADRGMTIQSMMAVYAPAGDGSNNPQLYAQNVANALGVDPNTPLTTVLSDQYSPASTSTPATTPAPAPEPYYGDSAGEFIQAGAGTVDWGMVGIAAAIVATVLIASK